MATTLYRDFCFSWKTGYLKELQKRSKRQIAHPYVDVNDVVVVRDENLPQNSWRLGRITQLHPGRDNRVRVVDLQTERGTITRPISKLIRLPMPPQ